MEVTFLGTGTSHGIPVLTCNCKVCTSINPKNKRLRSSILIKGKSKTLVVDTTPEFRIQILRENITEIDGLLYTHTHADHLHGIDDIRPFSVKKHIPIYGRSNDLEEIDARFPYIFNQTPQKGGGKPNLYKVPVVEKINIDEIEITPIPIKHGLLDIYGYRFNNVAYLTDCSYIPESSYELLKGLDILIINALRYREHSTHFNLEQSVLEIEKINPKIAYLTHICHDLEHDSLIEELDEMSKNRKFIKKIKPAHDGLCFRSN